jgi:hypothetical protein
MGIVSIDVRFPFVKVYNELTGYSVHDSVHTQDLTFLGSFEFIESSFGSYQEG